MSKTKTDSTDNWNDQYKDPRWQKKRLEVLEHDNFTCCSCKSKDDHLHVHHSYYAKGNKIWEYPVSSLLTLCDTCHSNMHRNKSNIDELVISDLYDNVRYEGEFNIYHLTSLLYAIVGDKYTRDICKALALKFFENKMEEE